MEVAPLDPSHPPPGLRDFLAEHTPASSPDSKPDSGSSRFDGLLAAAALDPWTALLAHEGGRLRAVLQGLPTIAGFRILEVLAAPGDLEPALDAFIDALAGEFPGQRIEARVVHHGEHRAPLDTTLSGRGAKLALEQVLYALDIDEPALADSTSLVCRSYEGVGKVAAVELLGRIFAGAGRSGRMSSDALRELDQMLLDATGASSRPDTSLWRIVFEGDEPIGLFFPHLLGDAARSGTLLYLGLVEEWRGRGRAHAMGHATRRALYEAGARRYVEATESDNAAARGALEKYGCVATGEVHRYYVVRPERAEGHLQRFQSLLEYLNAERYPHEVRPGQLVRVRMRFGPCMAVFDLHWMEHMRVVQAIHRFEGEVPEEARGRLALAVAALNAGIGMPGFLLSPSPKSGGLVYRLPIFLDPEGGIAITRLRSSLALFVQTVATHASWWRELLREAGTPASTSLLDRVPVRRRP